MAAMIVAPQPVAVEEGAKVLQQGGNAVDAALTCAMVQGVVDPNMCGVGGYLICNLHPSNTASRSSASLIVDAPAVAGSKATPTMWEDAVLRPNPDGWGYFLKDAVNDIGYRSICVPGAVRGLHALLTRWGTRSWEQILEPASRVAQEGFPVGATQAMNWKTPGKYPESVSLLGRMRANREASRLYLRDDGAPYEAGHTLRNPDYAATLRRLAENGPDDFYHGELAGQMLSDLQANGSYLTREDLEDYALPEAAPVVSTYRGTTVSSSPPPHGGATLAAILNILEGYDLSALGHNSPDYIYLVSMAMKAAFADRNASLSDPAFVDVPLEWMISKERADHWRGVIDSGDTIHANRGQPDSPHTTHVSVVDAAGNCVSLTHSLGMSSGVITPGLGFMYNNSMVNFHPYAGHPNSIAPRKGRTTGMTPTIVYRGDQPWVVIGAPGATRIITAVAQVLVNVIDFSMTMQEAVLAPRFNCQGDVIDCQARIPEFVCSEVRRRHPIQRLPQSHGALALVHAVLIDPKTGRLHGAADAGSGGMALAV